MKRTSWAPLLVLALLAGACNQTEPAQMGASTAAAASIVPAVPVKATAAAPETISSKDIRVNGLSFETTTAELVKTLGQPNKIEKDAVECGGHFENDKGDFYKYGPSLFEVNGKRAVMGTVDFSSGKFRVTIGQQVLDQNTSLAVISKLYPEATRNISAQHDKAAGKTYQVVSIQNPGTDDTWRLEFEQGKLVRFEHYTPC